MASAASSVKKLKKDLKSIKKAFNTVNTQLAKLKEYDSDISELEGEEVSHFQVDQALQFAQLHKKFEPTIAKLFKQAGSSIKLDLKEVILLESQSTMDLFCNAALLSKISKSISSMRLKINGSTMVVTRKATIEGYNKTVWFSTRAITNIIALRNLIDQYCVKYDSDDLMFVVHR
jgi:fumarate hydratase class II